MENNKLILVESFFNEKEAYKAKILLERNNIFHKFLKSRNNLEETFASSNSIPTEIWVYESDFEESYSLINENLYENDKIITPNISNYSNDELIDIIKNKDEWHISFLNEAKTILTNREIKIDEREVSEHSNKKLDILKQGKHAHPIAITMCWISAILSVPFLAFGFFGLIFGFMGTIAGYLYWQSKIKAFDNNKYFLFNIKTRTHGKFIFLTGLFSISSFLIYLYYQYSKILS